MTTRPGLAVASVAAILFSVAACSGNATTAPSAGASSAASPSAAASTAASSAPSISIPSAVASALASTGSVPDASTLVTADMAASVIGGSPTKITPPISIPNVSVASYMTTGGDTLTVFVEAIPGGVAAAELQAGLAMTRAQGQIQPVSDLGDAAGKVVNANDATVVFVKGSKLAVVQATSQSTAGSDLEPKLEAIAQQVAGKL